MAFTIPYLNIKPTGSPYHRTVYPTVLKNKRIHVAISTLQIPHKKHIFLTRCNPFLPLLFLFDDV